MEYKQFAIKPFERKPGKWRASIERVDGETIVLTADYRPKPAKLVIGVDAKSAQAAMLKAMAAIDAGAITKHPESGDDPVS
jgi:hypothetical protein